jgi:5' nucleotidase, deoxy (Pyrimidine), cytosolic type C protein (NT5C)
MVQIFLDCDGVLADFDSLSIEIFGQHPRDAEARLSSPEFWRILRNHGSFYRDLPPLPDARELYDGVAHLDPIILTGCPEGGWAEAQKVAWAAKHFPNVRIITCRSSEKRRHMARGDILVDDYPVYRHLWEEAGGIFVLHTSAADSLKQLASLGIPVLFPPTNRVETSS